MPKQTTVGDQYFPDVRRRVDSRAAINATAWLSAARIDQPVGRRTFEARHYPRDRRVAVQSQAWLSGWNIVQLTSVPSVAQPAGAQYLPTGLVEPLSLRRRYANRITWTAAQPLSQTAQAYFAGSGSFIGVAPASGVSVGSLTGSGAFAAVGASSVASVGTFTGSGMVTASGGYQVAATFTISGLGAVAGVGVGPAPGVATFASGGGFTAQAVTVDSVVVGWNTDGQFQAMGLWSAPDPLDPSMAWSVQIYGSIIEGVIYDPITKWMKVLYTNNSGQYTLLPNQPLTITNMIQSADDPQAVVLSLLR